VLGVSAPECAGLKVIHLIAAGKMEHGTRAAGDLPTVAD
jgi:hypothetical protein